VITEMPARYRIALSVLCLVVVLAASSRADISSYVMDEPLEIPELFYIPPGKRTISALHTDSRGQMLVPIGFDFAYDGKLLNVIGISPDGLLWMDAAATGAPLTNDLDGGTGVDGRCVIAPLWDDLDGCGGEAELSVVQSGERPYRTCTVSWEKWHWNRTNGHTISFQVTLQETTGLIQFQYRPGFDTPISPSASVGFSGAAAGNFISVQTLGQGATASSVTANDAIASLDVAPSNDLRLTFWPPQIMPHTDLAVTGQTGTSISLQWTPSASPNLLGSRIYISDGSGHVPVADVGPGISSYTIGNLGWATNYDILVLAYGDGSTAEAFVQGSTLAGTAPNSFLVTGASAADSLTGAIATINALGLSGDTLIELAAGYSQANDTFPITMPNRAGADSRVTIRPAAGATNIVLSRTTAYPTVLFDNAKYVTIDGRPGGVGGLDGTFGQAIASNLTISNTRNVATANTGAVLITNESAWNTLNAVRVIGKNPSPTAGVVTILGGATITTRGSDSNYVTNSVISSGALPATTTAACGYYLIGGPAPLSGTFRYDQLSSDNRFLNNSVQDMFLASATHSSIFLGAGTTNYEVRDNLMYQTQSRAVTAGINVQGLSAAGVGPATIRRNTFGPNWSGAGQFTFTLTGGASRTVAYNISLDCSLEPVYVWENGCSSMNITTTSGGSPTNGVFTGMNIGGLTSGNYYLASNYMGDYNSTYHINIVAPGGPDCYAAGYHIGSSAAGASGAINNFFSLHDHAIGINLTSTNATAQLALYGVYDNSDLTPLNASFATSMRFWGTIVGEQDGFLRVGNNTSTTGSNTVMGIRFDRRSVAGALGGQVFDRSCDLLINDTFMNNLRTRQSTASAGPATGLVRGISIGAAGSTTMQAKATIRDSNVYELTGIGNTAGSEGSSAIIGIYNASPVSGQEISRCNIYSLLANPHAAGAASSMSVVGIYAHGSGDTGSSIFIDSNHVGRLDNNSTSATANVDGIVYGTGRVLVENNMVFLGSDPANAPVLQGNLSFSGIRDLGVGTQNQVEHNSVLIFGSGVGAGSARTTAFTRANPVTGNLSLRNNIFENRRSNSSGTGRHFGVVLDTLANITLNDNIYYHTGGAGSHVGGLGATTPVHHLTLADWQTATGMESGGRFGEVPFIDRTAGDLHVLAGSPNLVESLTAASGLVFNDHDGDDRASFVPGNVDIGADAFAFDVINPTVAISSSSSDPTSDNPIVCSATFDEPVTEFTAGEIQATGATVSNFAGSGSVYTFDLIPLGPGLITAFIDANVSVDGSGNTNVASPEFLRTFGAAPPTVTITSAAPDPTNNSIINCTAIFSEPVTGFVAADITPSNGTVSLFAGSGDVYTFRLIASGQGLVTADIAAGVATSIATGEGNNAAPTFGRTFDSVRPDVTLSSTSPNPTATSPIPVTVTFTEPVFNFVAGDVSSTNSTLSNFTGSGTTYTFDLTPLGQGSVNAWVSANVATDAANNLSTSSGTLTRVYDTVGSTITLSSSATNPTNVSPIPITVVFNESVTGFATGDIAPVNGTVANLSGSGANYSFDLIPSGQGNVSASVPAGAALDSAGNASQASNNVSRLFDTVQPAVAISSFSSDPTNVTPIACIVTFSETVTGFVAADITPSNAFVSGFTGAGPNYTFNLVPLGQGSVGASIAAGVAADMATNPNTASNAFSRTFDTIEPTVVIASATLDPTNANPIACTVTFSESVTNFIATDITPTNATIGGFSGTGANYSFNLIPSGQGNVSASIAAGVAADAAANLNVASNTLTRVFDSVAPTVNIASPTSNPTFANPISCTVTFSEPVTGFLASDIVPTNASVAAFAGTGANYTFDLVPVGQGVVGASIAIGVATDSANNTNGNATNLSRTFDSIAPTVIIATAVSDPTNSNPIPCTVTFSEPVTGFFANDIITVDCTILNFVGSGANYTFNLIPSVQGVVSVIVDAGAGFDAASNINVSSNLLSRTFDSIAPSVTLTSAIGDPTNAPSIPVTIQFSEPVANFVVGDLVVAGTSMPTLAGFAVVDADTYTVNILPVNAGSVTLNLPAGAANDAATNVNSAAVTFTRNSTVPVELSAFSLE